MQRIVNWSLKNAIAIVILCILVLGSGYYASTKIKQSIIPDVDTPVLLLQFTVPGQSAEANEKIIAKPVEDQILNNEEVNHVTTRISGPVVMFIVEYKYGIDIEKEKTKLESIAGSIRLQETPQWKVVSFTDHISIIQQFAITTKGNKEQLQEKLNDQLIPDLKKIEGVADVELLGEAKTKWLIELDIDKAMASGVSLETVRAAIEGKNVVRPVGSVEAQGNTFPIELRPQVDEIEDIKSLTFSTQGMPSTSPAQQMLATPGQVKLSDIATFKQVDERTEIVRYNGEPSLVLNVSKEPNADTLKVSELANQVIDRYAKQEKFQAVVLMDHGEEINTSISKLLKEGMYGALFTILVIAVFLRSFRATLISIFSLPISILATIFFLDQLDYSLNILTLGGLAVAIGRIVDDSIVVIENIYRWLQEKGEQLTKKEIVVGATKEVMKAIASSTLVTIIVFLPLAFFQNMAGEYFKPFALAVSFSIFVSLLVAVMLIPILAKTFFKAKQKEKKESRLVKGYDRLLRVALKRRGWVMVIAVLLLIGSLSLIQLVGFSFMPAGKSTQIMFTFTLPDDIKLAETDKVAKKVEEKLKEKKEVKDTWVQLGQGMNMTSMGQKKENEGLIYIKLKSGQDADQLATNWEKELSQIVRQDYPEAKIMVFAQATMSQGNSVNVSLFGTDPVALEKASKQVEELLLKNKQVQNVKNEMEELVTRWEISLNSTGTDLGLNTEQLMGMIYERLRSAEITEYEVKDKTIDLSIRYNKPITNKNQLLDIAIVTPAGVKQLKEVANLQEVKTSSVINRRDGKVYASVTAEAKGNDTSSVFVKVQNDLDKLDLPDGVTASLGGGNEELNDMLESMGVAMIIAVGLVFLVLCMTFHSLLTPLVILTSILFVPVGAFGGLYLTGQPLSISSLIGLLMLIGIVVTNAVVLLDRVEANRQKGMTVDNALIEAGKVRLRPILMTAFATIFALIPLAVSSDVESISAILISKGLAITVIGGLFTSTMLTLIFVPALYRLVERIRLNKDRFEHVVMEKDEKESGLKIRVTTNKI